MREFADDKMTTGMSQKLDYSVLGRVENIVGN